jgi:CBS domain-containing protein
MTATVEFDVEVQPQIRTAADVMSAPVVTVSRSESLWQAWSVLYRSGFRHVVVVDGLRVAGIIDDRRILREWPFGPLEPHHTVGDVIPRRTHCVLPTTAVAVVARIMLDDAVDAVPVVTERGELAGLVTTSDLLREVAVAG